MEDRLPPDMVIELEKVLGQVRTDLPTRLLYSTDASIYQIDPLGVGFPRHKDELAGAVEIANRYGIPILARGSGSSLAGQAIGPALVLDCSRYLTQITNIEPDQRIAIVEPGVILTTLNKAAEPYGLQFGPDPASAERATVGGSLSNNATGAHSIIYGMAADHLISAEVVLSDGSLAEFKNVPVENGVREAKKGTRLGNLYRTALHIREQKKEVIQKNWPRTWRNASGYPVNYLLPWSPSSPPQWRAQGWIEDNEEQSMLPYPPVPEGHVNLAPLLAGSEGTLAIIRSAKLRLVSLHKHTILGVLAYHTLVEACEAVPILLDYCPSAIELIPESLIRLARSLPAYARQVAFIEQLFSSGQKPAAMLVVEFSGDNPKHLLEQVKRLGEGVLIADTKQAQTQVWAVRKVGLGILNSRPGDQKPIAFIEDIAVPVERLGVFVREMEAIFKGYHTNAEFYAHASAGCLHIRPILDLKSPQGRQNMRAIASQAVDLAITLGGSASGEHGDGLARSEWLEKVYGKEIIDSFQQLKNAADPKGILNPGKIVSTSGSISVQKMDQNLRYGEGYHSTGWEPIFDFSRHGGDVIMGLEGRAGVAAAVEMCNGAGVCRKAGGVMCPSFQATHEEMHNTRGRANLLRAMLSGRFSDMKSAEKTVYEALDLCLACKGCKSECPSGVDMAKLRYEFLHHYYLRHRRRIRDYLFAYIGRLAYLGYPLAPLANLIMGSPIFKQVGLAIGLTPSRSLPKLAPKSFSSLAKDLIDKGKPDQYSVLFLSDAFTDYFYPEVGLSALRVLKMAGYRVHLLPVSGAGRTLISKGFLEAARVHAKQLVDAIDRSDPAAKLPVVGVEPSEILTLRDEYYDLFPGGKYANHIDSLASRSYCIDEFLLRPGYDGSTRISRLIAKMDKGSNPSILLHGHCYQKTLPPAQDGYPNGVAATAAILEMAGCQVELIDAGCCGMAGAFGYETEHYDLSMKVGELALFPRVREANPNTVIVAAGVSCQAQIKDGARREAIHPVVLLDKLLNRNKITEIQ
jgi:FAD/FMN-containing dehydrogenase/Fe-S oxidoreductase